MRLLLVSFNQEIAPYPVMPLGVMYLAHYLRLRGIRVDIHDRYLADDQALAQRLSATDYAAVGISIRNIDNILYPKTVSYLKDLQDLVGHVKQHTRAPVILGGSGYSIFPGSLLAATGADYGICGEGEVVLYRLLRDLGDPDALAGLPGLYRRHPGGVLGPTNTQSLINTEFTNSFPLRDTAITAPYLKTGGMVNIQLKRGCPFGCIYCTYPLIDGRTVRLRDSHQVVAEIAYLKQQFNFDYFYFVDSVFNYPLEEARRFVRALRASNLHIKWTAFFNPRFVDHAFMQDVYASGCREVEFGAEAGADQVLAALGKGFCVNDITRAHRICRDIGIKTAYYFMIGSPGETRETIDQSIAFFDQLNPDAVFLMPGIRIYPKTALHAIAVEQEVVSSGNDLLQPVFYAQEPPMAYALERLQQKAAQDARWVFPSLGLNFYPELLIKLRKFGAKGPLWSRLKRTKPHKSQS